MKVKKFLCIMSLALIISLSSCNKNEVNNSSLTSDTSTETSKVILSEEDDVSVIDSSSEDNNNSQTWISENDSNSDSLDNNDNSVISEQDNSSVSSPDDNSSFSEPDISSASMPDDNSNILEPDNSTISSPDDNSNISDNDNTSSDFIPDDSSATTDPDSSIDMPSITDNSSLSDILKAILSNDNVNSFNGLMKNFVKDYLSGQDTLFIREFSSSSTRLFDLSISETSIINSAICVEPYEDPIEYCCYLIKLNEGTDKDKIKSEIFSSLNKNRWGCTTAEKAIVIDSGNVILALMASEAETYAYVEAFKEVMGTTGTVLSK